MSPLIKNDNEYNHIEFLSEPDYDMDRRTKDPFPNPPKPVIPESRSSHGAEIASELNDVIEETKEARKISGINPEHLFVLEFETINCDIHKVLESKFNAIVVRERLD